MAGRAGNGRRGFGSVRKLPSGRFQARYTGPDGIVRTGGTSFATKREADAFLATAQADIVRRSWAPEPVARPTLTDFGTIWVEQRVGIKESTRVQYALDFRRHVEPYLGRFTLDEITPELVRQWYAELGDDLREQLAQQRRRSTATTRSGRPTQARSYRLLRTILGTAVDDGQIASNPCRIRGAGVAPAAERPTLTTDEVAALSDEVPGQYRAFVMLAAYGGIRAGELAALRIRDLRLDDSPSVSVVMRVYRVRGRLDVDAPKSRAGRRVVPIPEFVAEELGGHLRAYRPGAGPDDLVFVTRTGGSVLNTYSQSVSRALARIGRPDVRVHDLRHTGSRLAAEAGASLPELMRRLGHSTVDAAAVYLHASEDHGRAVAVEMGRRAAAGRRSQRN